MTLLISIVASCALGASADEAPVHAQLDPAISIAHCLDTIDAPNDRDEARCPGFAARTAEGRQEDLRRGGWRAHRHTGTPTSGRLDVDGDGVPEFVFEYGGNVQCEGAWSVFDCGSLGCARAIYKRQAGGWRAITQISADAPQTLELTGVAVGQGYRDLRVGCEGNEPCAVYSYYHWTGEQYDLTHLDVRSHRVEFATSIHGLYGLTGPVDVLAEPTQGAASVGHYDADIEVAIVGTATDVDYYYVSPCNACDSGFIPKSAVRPLQP